MVVLVVSVLDDPITTSDLLVRSAPDSTVVSELLAYYQFGHTTYVNPLSITALLGLLRAAGGRVWR